MSLELAEVTTVHEVEAVSQCNHPAVSIKLVPPIAHRDDVAAKLLYQDNVVQSDAEIAEQPTIRIVPHSIHRQMVAMIGALFDKFGSSKSIEIALFRQTARELLTALSLFDIDGVVNLVEIA